MNILAIDIGNTSTLFAIFSGQRISEYFRISTGELNERSIRSLRKKILKKNLDVAVIASVVPQAKHFLYKTLKRDWGLKAYVIGVDFDAPILNRYERPSQVGIDRLVNAAAAYHQYAQDLIVIDFGTAITFDVITRKGEYLGGVIAPGIEISLEALYQRTALLPKIRLAHAKNLIGRDTIESIRIGCSVGIGGLCDRLVERISKRYRIKPKVIATGGYAKFMKRYCACIDKTDPALTMKGIFLSYKKFLTKKIELI